MNAIKRYLSHRRDLNRQERDHYLRSLIEVKERCGQIWITCDGHAIFSFDGDTKASMISEIAERMREASVSYDKYEAFYADDSENETPTVIFNIQHRNEEDYLD